MFYGGLVRTKNVLGTMAQSFAAMGIIGILWVAIGYSMTFGSNVAGGWFGWNSDYVFLDGIDMVILDSGIPEYVFAMFQGKFAILTPIILAGAFAERVKFSAYCLFIALWSVIVYNPLCHWVWAADGFLFNHGAAGAIDFAGGTVVHISSGVSGLVVALLIGARRGYGKVTMLPNNMVMVLIGTGLLWVGWFGFNAGSAVSSGLDTARALTVTQVSAAAGALSWMLIEFVHHKKATALGLASGILAGLVAITPAAGSVQPLGAMFLGLLVSPVCYAAILFKNKLGYDDTLDAFGIHGVGGIFGAIGLTFFVRDAWWTGAQEAATEAGLGAWGLLDQLWVQIYAVLITIGYSSVMTVIIFFAVKAIVGFRLSEFDETKGQDKTQHDESGYGFLNIDS
jgi:ammonium transporter, Amt family